VTKDFEFLRELGKGGYGAVYLVRVTENAKKKLQYAYKNGNHKHRDIPDIVALKKI
jgi:serine/threonine protein kinase